jgi:hypothetical protein
MFVKGEKTHPIFGAFAKVQKATNYRGADKSLTQPTSLSTALLSREQVVVRRGQIRRIGWVIKTLEAQVG